MSKIIRLIDRTRTVQDWKCPRARYWGYEYRGRGIVKSSTSLELFIGITVHDALAAIATLHSKGLSVDIDEIASQAATQIKTELLPEEIVLPESVEFANEQAALVEGLVRGFYKHTWPKLLAEYPIIRAIETEMEYKLGTIDGVDPEGNKTTGDLIFMTKPDLILENNEGDLVYIEYKTTSSKKDNWVNSWETAVQLHSSIMAAEQTLGTRPAYVRIVGLYKGYESYGKQSSPFCYAYVKKGNPPFTKDQVRYDFVAGFRRSPTWEMDGGVKAWVENMPDNILADQFPMTGPIFVDEDLVKAFFRQRTTRENEIAEMTKYIEDHDLGPDELIYNLDDVFPQRFDQCVPGFGKPCQYKKLCHGRVGDPLTEGFELREPHHEQERKQLGLDEVN